MGKISETITGYPFNTGDELSSKSLNEITEALDGIGTKQDVITDLGTIRSGAALGATAVQPNALNNYYTKNETDAELATKQDTLTAGDNIQIENNVISATDTKYVAGDFDIKDLNDTTGLRTKWDNAATLAATAIQPEVLEQQLSNYLTETEVNALITKIHSFEVEIVDALPASGNTHTIYFVPAGDGVESDFYNEYMYINGKMELIGNTRIDLSGYYTKNQIDVELATKQNTLVAGTNIEISGDTISSKVYEASDFDIKDLSDADGLRATWSSKQDAITDLDDIRSGAALGETAIQESDLQSALSGYYTSGVTDDKLATKQDVIDNLSEIEQNAASGKTAFDSLITKQDVIEDLEAIRTGAALGATAVQESDLQTTLSGYYTSGVTDDLLDEKQDVIEDLGTIRSGAALGETAVQESDLQTALNAYYTSGVTDELLDAKQDVLTAGSHIEISGDTINVVGLSDVLYTEITYSELVSLRDASGLTPGMQYRLTDYTTTVNPSLTDVQSAGHVFDIILVADDESTLNENVRFTYHEGDTYFTVCKLEAWEGKYCLDNDTNKFDWTDPNGKGVIYEMTDEFNNTLPYDFKNIQFKRLYSVGRVEGYVGVDGFETWSDLSFSETNYKYLYTFSMIGETDIYDTSLNIYSNNINLLSVRNNCYSPNTINGKLYLNNIVHACSELLEEGFECEGVENTKTGINCYNISMKDKCDNWVLGNNCHDIIMNMKCEDWVCEDDCYNLTFGLNCSSWKLGHNCYNVSVGDVCIEWVCGDDCSGWLTGSNNSNWNCGSDCMNWETGPECNYWVCGNKCHNWKTGADCSYWTCGNNSHTWEVSDSNSFWTCGNAAYYWKVENTCRNFNVCNGVHGTSSTNKLVLNFPAYTELTKQQQINASFNEYDMLTIWNPASPINYPIIKRTDTGPSASERIFLAPNVYNIWINNKLPKYVTLAMPKTDMVGEYVLRFTIPNTVTNHNLVFSNEIKWVDNNIPTWEAGCTYEISIIDGYATFLKYFE